MNLSGTFALFSNFEANHDTRVELCLAMAAVGGLYCTAYAHMKVAKMLFNDARRLLLEQYLQQISIDFSTSLSFSKTFILLEIYGLCSGDKRAYEFIEVFHANRGMVSHTYGFNTSTNASFRRGFDTATRCDVMSKSLPDLMGKK